MLKADVLDVRIIVDSVWTGWRVWSVCWARGLPSNQAVGTERREIARALLLLSFFGLGLGAASREGDCIGEEEGGR